jgi:response regulator RpfG family c-di-GMP phosphodiesterase
MKRLLIASTALVITLTGCANYTEKVAPRIAQGVRTYCTEPLSERQLIRSQVNSQIAPARIKVTCPGDPE